MNKANYCPGKYSIMKAFLLMIVLFFSGLSFAQSSQCQWARSSGTIGNGQAGRVATDRAGNEYIAGIFYDSVLIFGTDTMINSQNGTADIYIVKYSYNGGILWAKRIGGTQNDDVSALATDKSGNLYVTGYYESPNLAMGLDTLRSPGNSFLVKYDPAGNELWAVTSKGGSEPSSVVIDPAGNPCIFGNYWNAFTSFGNDTLRDVNYRGRNIFVTKYSSSGSVIWAKSADKSADGNSFSNNMVADASGNLFLSGDISAEMVFGADTLKPDIFAEHSIFLIKLDSNGSTKWVRWFGSFGYPPNQYTTIDATGNVFLVGNFTIYPITFGTDTLLARQYDIFIVKYNTAGGLVWAKTAGSGNTAEAMVYGTCTDPAGNLYVTGYFSKPLLTIGADTLYNPDTAQVISLLKFDNNGNSLWAKGAGQHGYNVGSSVASDALGNIFITGNFSDSNIHFDTVSFSPGTTHSYGVYLAKYGYTNESVVNNSLEMGNLVLYPNPVYGNNELTATFQPGQYDRISIFNSTGQCVAHTEIGNNETKVELKLQSMPDGIYYLKAKGQGNVMAQAFIIRR